MLHHVTLEVDPADAEAFGELLEAIGFVGAPVPGTLGVGYRWFERGGSQIHLALVADPDVPRRGHAALVVDPLRTAVERLEEIGYECEERRRHWGARRVTVEAPGGHRIELMEAPPGAS